MRRMIAFVCVCALVFSSSAPVWCQTADHQAPEALRPEAGTVVVLAAAPILLSPDATSEPLRVAKEGSVLRLVERDGEWCNVEFQDPQYGRRIGYIQSKYVQQSDTTERLAPLDLSVTKAQRPSAVAPTPPKQSDTATVAKPGMAAKYKVWGTILTIAGGYYLASALFVQPNEVVCVRGSCASTNDLRPIWAVIGSGLVIGGVSVFAVGDRARRTPSANIAIAPGKITVQGRIALGHSTSNGGGGSR
jgi:hypothetical protein